MVNWLCIHGGIALFSFGISLAFISGDFELWGCPWSVAVLCMFGTLALMLSGILLLIYGIDRKLK